MTSKIHRSVRGFLGDQKGTLSVEAAIVMPLLFWAITATFTFFHGYKAQTSAYRANYTISDILSRETVQIGQGYLDGLHNVYQYMTLARTEGTWLRLSVVRCLADCTTSARDLDIMWSRTTNGARELENADISFWKPKVPWVPKGDSLILLETSSNYSPPFTNFLLSFPDRTLVSHSVTRPRFAPQLLWTGMSVGDDGIVVIDEIPDDGAPI